MFTEVESLKKMDLFVPNKQVAEKNDSFIMSREAGRLCISVRQQESMALGSGSLLRPNCHSEVFQHTGPDSSDKPVLLSITATRLGWKTHPAEGWVHANRGQREAQEGRQGQDICYRSRSS